MQSKRKSTFFAISARVWIGEFLCDDVCHVFDFDVLSSRSLYVETARRRDHE